MHVKRWKSSVYPLGQDRGADRGLPDGICDDPRRRGLGGCAGKNKAEHGERPVAAPPLPPQHTPTPVTGAPEQIPHPHRRYPEPAPARTRHRRPPYPGEHRKPPQTQSRPANPHRYATGTAHANGDGGHSMRDRVRVAGVPRW